MLNNFSLYILSMQALSDYSTVLLLCVKPNFKVFINRGLLYLELQDFNNALLDLLDAVKVIHFSRWYYYPYAASEQDNVIGLVSIYMCVKEKAN